MGEYEGIARSMFDGEFGCYLPDYKRSFTRNDWQHTSRENLFSSRGACCDMCGYQHIQPGDFISLGQAFVGDAEDSCACVAGESRVHCETLYVPEEHVAEAMILGEQTPPANALYHLQNLLRLRAFVLEHVLHFKSMPKQQDSDDWLNAQLLKGWNEHIMTLPGYQLLPMETKIHYFKVYMAPPKYRTVANTVSGEANKDSEDTKPSDQSLATERLEAYDIDVDAVQTPPESALQTRLFFNNFEALGCGDLSYGISSDLRKNGGELHSSLLKKVKYIVLGKDGVNEYGRPTGTKSKKYKEAVKAGLTVVTEKWCRDHLEEFESGKEDKTAEELLAARRDKLRRLAKLKADSAPSAPPPAKKRRIKRDEEEEEEGQESKKEKEKEKESDEKKDTTELDALTAELRDDGVLVQKPPPRLTPKERTELSSANPKKRKRLQTLAKKYNLNAGLPDDKLIENLLELF